MRNFRLRGMASLLAVLATAVVLNGCCVSVQIGGRHTPFYGPEHREGGCARMHYGRECPRMERDEFCPTMREGREYPTMRERGERRELRGREECPTMHERPMMHERPECPMMRDGKPAPAGASENCKCRACDKTCGAACPMHKGQARPMNRDGKPVVPPPVPTPPEK